MAKKSRVQTYINTPDTDASGTPAKKRGKSRFLTFLLLLILIGAGAAYGAYAYLQQSFEKPAAFPEDVVFDVPRGAGVSLIAGRLESQGLIENADIFKVMVRLEGDQTGLKAGEYLIPARSNMREIYKTLTDGKAILYPFTVPEGLTSAQIMRMMAAMDTLSGELPETPAEGTLLPETYMTPRGMSRSALVKQMQDAQTMLLNENWDNRQPNLPYKTKAEAIILASIVEKETGISGERDKVAGVFINRLNRPMRLESDPTIIYGITGGEPLGRGIRRSEIDRRTDWNTYQIDGLPKTPICNPGREAILAVLNPGKTDAIFFVADGTGGHVFARTLAEHNRNVVEWRKIERERKRRARAGE